MGRWAVKQLKRVCECEGSRWSCNTGSYLKPIIQSKGQRSGEVKESVQTGWSWWRRSSRSEGKGLQCSKNSCDGEDGPDKTTAGWAEDAEICASSDQEGRDWKSIHEEELRRSSLEMLERHDRVWACAEEGAQGGDWLVLHSIQWCPLVPGLRLSLIPQDLLPSIRDNPYSHFNNPFTALWSRWKLGFLLNGWCRVC